MRDKVTTFLAEANDRSLFRRSGCGGGAAATALDGNGTHVGCQSCYPGNLNHAFPPQRLQAQLGELALEVRRLPRITVALQGWGEIDAKNVISAWTCVCVLLIY